MGDIIRKLKPGKSMSTYIPYDFYSTYEMFTQLVLLDEKIDKSDPKIVNDPSALRSVIVRKLISAYVNANKIRLNIKHEASQIASN